MNDDVNKSEFDIEVPDIPLPPTESTVETVEDEFAGAFRFAVIGSGQGGGRLAMAFHKLGYRRVAAINTASQDLATLPLPEKNKMLIGEGGAGKDPKIAQAAFDNRQGDVLDFMRRCFGPSFDRIIVAVGAGGGTGAGTVNGLIHTALELQQMVKAPRSEEHT